MPKYNNLNTKHSNGAEFLTLKPAETDIESEFFYEDIDELHFTDVDPYYNPVHFKQIIKYSVADGGSQTWDIEFPYDLIGQNKYILIDTIGTSIGHDAIEIFFNSITNTPSIPLNNSSFILNNNHRIRRVFITVNGANTGSISVLIGDKYLAAQATMGHVVRPF